MTTKVKERILPDYLAPEAWKRRTVLQNGSGRGWNRPGERFYGKTRQGFTLMEVAMAVLVMAIGVTAAFSLISSGLTSSAKAQEDTVAQLFADNVFNGLRALNLEAAARCKTDPEAWRDFWKDIDGYQIPVTLAPEEAWKDSVFEYKPTLNVDWNVDPHSTGAKLGIYGAPLLQPRMNLLVRRIDFRNSTFGGRSRGNREISNHTIRYRLRVQRIIDDDPTDDKFIPERARVTLFVWPGKFGEVKDEDALVFYSEYNNPGYL